MRSGSSSMLQQRYHPVHNPLVALMYMRILTQFWNLFAGSTQPLPVPALKTAPMHFIYTLSKRLVSLKRSKLIFPQSCVFWKLWMSCFLWASFVYTYSLHAQSVNACFTKYLSERSVFRLASSSFPLSPSRSNGVEKIKSVVFSMSLAQSGGFPAFSFFLYSIRCWRIIFCTALILRSLILIQTHHLSHII